MSLLCTVLRLCAAVTAPGMFLKASRRLGCLRVKSDHKCTSCTKRQKGLCEELEHVHVGVTEILKMYDTCVCM